MIKLRPSGFSVVIFKKTKHFQISMWKKKLKTKQIKQHRFRQLTNSYSLSLSLISILVNGSCLFITCSPKITWDAD